MIIDYDLHKIHIAKLPVWQTHENNSCPNEKQPFLCFTLFSHIIWNENETKILSFFLLDKPILFNQT